MAGGRGYYGGGILSLLDLLDEHGEAVEYDLIERGLRLAQLGTEALTWRDLKVLVRFLPRTSALYRSRVGDEVADWSGTDHLLAGIYDLLNSANYQRSVASGKKGVKKPRPLPRPGVKERVKKFGRGAIPLSKFADWWTSKKQK